MRKTFVSLLLLGLGATGCGGSPARFDATDDASQKASLLRIEAPMSAAQKKQFEDDYLTASYPAVVSMAIQAGGSGQPTRLELEATLKPLHGMTAAEIHAKAEAVRAKRR